MDLKKFSWSFENVSDDNKQKFAQDLLKQGTEVCRSSFDRLNEYFQIMELLIKEALEHELESLEQTANDLPVEKEGHFWAWNYPTYLENIPPLLRSSFLIALYSLFENQLELYCGTLKDFERISLSLSDLSGSKIEKAKKYIHKVAGYPVVSKELWDEIMDFALVRNCIVHNCGFINKKLFKETQLRTILHKYQEISLEHDRIIPHEEYCKRMLTSCRQLLEDLYNESLKRIK
jgi:hypothetical protein